MHEMWRARVRQIALAYLVSFGVWCMFSVLTAWQYYRINDGTSLRDMLLIAQARGFSFALLTPPVFYVVRRYTAGMKRSFSYLWVYALGAGPFMLVYGCVRWLVLPPWCPDLQRFVRRSDIGPIQLIAGGFADQITIYVAIVVTAHAYNYFERVRKQEVEKYEYEQALAASELQALKMQLHPHFLFNTLHGISTLIDSDQKSAKSMVVKLSDLLRTALQYRGTDLISLQEELRFVREYLDLEKMRLGPRLTVDWFVDPTTEKMLVPQMLLQPLVENAIRHGIAGSRGNGWIEISAQKAAGLFELRIRNSVGQSRPPGTGLGLPNVQTRLRHLYAGEATFSFAVSDDKIAVTTVRLPILGVDPPLLIRRGLDDEAGSGGVPQEGEQALGEAVETGNCKPQRPV
jgi:two-component system LytT family sensor kinase